jgi:hypothetical protein
MRKSILILSILALLLVCGCTHKEYDAPEGVNREMTLFGEEISIPVGSVGPITVEDLISSNPTISSLINQLMKEDSQGNMYAECEEEFFKQNAFELSYKIPDISQPYHWELEDQYASISSPASLLKMFGFKFPKQYLAVTLRNPLRASIKLNGLSRAEAGNYVKEIKFEDFLIPSGYSATTIAEFTIPDNIMDMIDAVQFKKITLDLPANVPGISREGDAAQFVLKYRHTSQMAVGSTFSFSSELPLNNLNLNIGKYKLRKGTLSFNLESSLPFDITIKSVKVMNEKSEVNPNIVVTPDITLPGGTLEKPSVTPVNVTIEATEGAIPDIKSIRIAFAIKSAEGAGTTPLNSNMGISFKSASATLRGGVTIFGHEK